MSKTPGVTKTGACLCGKIKFKVEGEAATPLWCTICHCLNCKRRSGSALYTAAICPKNVGWLVPFRLELLVVHSDVTLHMPTETSPPPHAVDPTCAVLKTISSYAYRMPCRRCATTNTASPLTRSKI